MVSLPEKVDTRGARLLNRSHATISREIRRNKYYYYVPTYYPHPAQFYYEQRMKERAKRIKLKSIEAQQYVADKLKLGWRLRLSLAG